eukprot:2917692-Rhodomonas_salina.1
MGNFQYRFDKKRNTRGVTHKTSTIKWSPTIRNVPQHGLVHVGHTNPIHSSWISMDHQLPPTATNPHLAPLSVPGYPGIAIA